MKNTKQKNAGGPLFEGLASSTQETAGMPNGNQYSATNTPNVKGGSSQNTKHRKKLHWSVACVAVLCSLIAVVITMLCYSEQSPEQTNDNTGPNQYSQRDLQFGETRHREEFSRLSNRRNAESWEGEVSPHVKAVQRVVNLLPDGPEGSVESTEFEIEGMVYTVVATDRRRSFLGGVVTSGYVKGVRGGGSYAISQRETALAGFILPDGKPGIRITGTLDKPILTTIDPKNLPPCPCDQHDRSPTAAQPVPAPDVSSAEASSSDTVVDLMIVWTDNLRRQEGGWEQMVALAEAISELSHWRFQASGCRVSLRLVHVDEVNYDESFNSSTDLNRLQNPSDGYMDEIHNLRDQYGADLVALLATDLESGVGGRAIIGNNVPDDEAHAFSVTAITSLGHAFTHELGHNFGCAHDRPNAGNTGVFDYSHGSLFAVDGKAYGTQMVNAPSERISYFSGPNVTYLGANAGSSTEDNVRTIVNTRETIAGYRTDVQEPGGGSNGDMQLISIEIDDDASGGSNGDGDGIPEAGETIELDIGSRNGSGASVSNVEATASILSGPGTLADDNVNIGDLAPGEEDVSGDLDLVIPASASNGAVIRIELRFVADESETRTEFSVVVGSGVQLGSGELIKLVRIEIDDDDRGGSNGDGDGIPEPGEDIELDVVTTVNGVTTVTSIEAIAFILDGPGTLTDEDVNVGDLSPGEQDTSGDFDVEIDSSASNGDEIKFALAYTSDQGESATTFTLVVGQGITTGSKTIELVRIEVDDDASGGSNGDGDGIVEVGETVELDVVSKASGGIDLTNVEATAVITSGPGILLDDDVNIGDLAAGEEDSSGDFDLQVPSSVPDGTKITLAITLSSDQGSTTFTHEITVKVDVDITPPVVVVSSHQEGQAVSGPTISVSGAASDRSGIVSVSYRVNEGEWLSANGTTSWSADLILAAGNNEVEVSAVDTAGNSSVPLKFTLSWAVPLAKQSLIVEPTANGGVDIKWIGELGKSYRVQISPDLKVWTDISASISGTGILQEYKDVGRTNEWPRAFYRVLEE